MTDQTSAHDPVNGYLPKGWTLGRVGSQARERDPTRVAKAAKQSMAGHVRAMLEFHKLGVPTVDYGNNIRQMALEEGVADAFSFPGLRAGLHPAAVLPRHRAVPLGRAVGRSRGHLPHRRQGEGADAGQRASAQLARHGAGSASSSRDCRRASAGSGWATAIASGLAFNEMVAKGELKAPIVIGRDHLDSGSVASPNRETEAMRDGSDAVSDWPLLNALLNCASGATWVSLHHGGGVGMGFSQHAGMVIVCDGTPEAARRIERVLWNDPATGVMRHADAGYEDAIACAREKGLKLLEHLTCGRQRCEANGP